MMPAAGSPARLVVLAAALWVAPLSGISGPGGHPIVGGQGSALRSLPGTGVAAHAQARGQAFWQALVQDCRVPEGESAAELVAEAVSLLGSPDPFWRDEISYGAVASCVYAKRALTADERRALVGALVPNLRRGIGESGTDSVLLRSFSALDLSVLAAVEDEDPALDAASYRGLLDAALGYLRDERDLRGIDPVKSWIHATAHTADLLKFLARDPRFAPADQARLLEAVWSKLTARGTPVFTHAEDERLAAAVAAIVRREDFDAAGFERWLTRFPALETELWSKSPPDTQLLDAAQNARNLLRSLFVALSLPTPVRTTASGEPAAAKPPADTAVVSRARDAVLETLGKVRR